MSTDLAPLTSAAARALTDEVKADAASLWAKLLQLYQGGAHTTLGYDSWADYCAAEFDMGRDYSYKLLASARVVEQLGESTNGRPTSERVARELVPVLKGAPEKVEEVWAEVVDQYGPEPTARAVRETVQRHEAPAPPAEPELYAFMTEVHILHSAKDTEHAEARIQRLLQNLDRQGATVVRCKTSPR